MSDPVRTHPVRKKRKRYVRAPAVAVLLFAACATPPRCPPATADSSGGATSVNERAPKSGTDAATASAPARAEPPVRLELVLDATAAGATVRILCGTETRVEFPSRGNSCGCTPGDLACAMKCRARQAEEVQAPEPEGGWPVIDVEGEGTRTCVLVIHRDGFEAREIVVDPKPGDHRVEISLERGQDEEHAPMPRPAAPLVCPNTAMLYLESEPSAQVFVDGRSLGQTPTSMAVLAGSHSVVFERIVEHHSSTKQLQVHVDGGAVRTIRVQM